MLVNSDEKSLFISVHPDQTQWLLCSLFKRYVILRNILSC